MSPLPAPETTDPSDVLSFWRAAGRERWFEKDDAFDAEIRTRFLATCQAAAAGNLDQWAATPEGALALVIVLDQFPRNIFRGSAQAFAADRHAYRTADAALSRGFDSAVPHEERLFFYLPFMHSENLADQERCIALTRAADLEDGLKYAELHADVIRRFGRFPHRNAALGRTTTEEEQAFLDAGGFAG